MKGWYPAAEAELSRFALDVLVPEGLTALSEADRISEIEVDTGRLVSFDFPHPVPGIHLILGPYVVSKDHYKHVRIETYFFPEDMDLAHNYLEVLKKYLKLYEELLGPYPFSRFAVVENIKPTGFGMPTFTLLGRQVLRLPFIPKTSLGHEILHSWFGNSIYVDSREGNWSEGLTTYLADHLYKRQKGEGWQYRRKIIEDFESYVRPGNEIVVRDFQGSNDRAVRTVGYGKAAMIFHMLKTRVGGEAFIRGIRFDVPPPVTGIDVKSLLSLEEIISRVAHSKVVFVGEKHDRYGDHLVQLEVIRGLYRLHPKLAIGMEMFQRPYQEALDRYISGTADEETFLRESRYFSTWRYNYYLYRDILQYARSEKIPVIALNQDNELVSRVAEVGLEKLNKDERSRIPEELDLEDASYENRLLKAFEMHRVELPGGRAPKVFEYFHQAQIVWDETMAETIANFLTRKPDYHVVVLAGNGHLEYGAGIPKRLRRRFSIGYAVILPDPGSPLEVGIADFIVFPGKAKAPHPPKLGISVDTSKGELEVKGFSHGSSAKEAGMEEGDVIMAVDNRPVKDIAELKASLAVRKIGDTVIITVKRKKERLNLQVKLAR